MQPATPEEIAGSAAFLNWTGAVLAWGRQGWNGLERAQAQGCSK